jgi:hypothetical protein
MAQDDRKDDGQDGGHVAHALEEARSRLAKAEKDRANLDRIIAAAREEERLLLRLVAIQRGEIPGPDEARPPGKSDASEGARDEQRVADDGAAHPSIQAVVAELAAVGRPLHISELMRLLHGRRVEIPGAGSQANLISHLRRDARLVRPSRGMYALAAWGLENMAPAQKRRRIKKQIRLGK